MLYTRFNILNFIQLNSTKGQKVIKTLKKLAVVSAVVAAFGFSAQSAQAGPYSCSDSTYGSGGSYSDTYSSCSANNTANSASTISTSTAVLATAATQSAGLVSNRVTAALGGTSAFSLAANSFSADTGMAAGDHGHRFGAWVSGTWSEVEDNNSDTAFDGNVYSAMVGADYKISPRTVLGLAIGYEDTDLDTEYNGFGGVDGSLEGDGYTIAPYVGVKLTEKSSASLTVGYSDLEYDTVRFDPNSGNQITGSTDADRYFIDAAVAGTHNFRENWNLHGKLGVFWASEDKDAFTETEAVTGSTISNASNETDFGQVSLDARVGYEFTHVEPYALVGADFDFSKDEAAVAAGQTAASLDEEDFGARFGAGLNFQLAPQVTGSFEGYTVEFRDDYEEYTFSGGLRVNF